MAIESIKTGLGVADYAVFVVTLATSTAIGIYFAYKDRKEASRKNYYFGGKRMNPVAVGLSLAVTFKSAVAVIATPAEAYISGTLGLWILILDVAVLPFALFYFIPAFHRLQLHTIFEFLELRFSVHLRKMAAAMLTLGTIFYISTVVYLPAVAFNAVTSFSLLWSIALTGGICTFYTTLGGMKAVVWTDVVQSGIMIFGVVGVFLKGLFEIGGVDELLAALERGERYTLERFDYGIVSRISPIALIFGGFIMSLDSISFSQTIVQRYQSCRNVRQAQCSLLVYIIPSSIISLTTIGSGFVMYAYYERCDPVLSGKLQKIDQGLPYMAMELFRNLPGMTGIFISAIFSASLSTVSSCLNSLSVVVLEDFLVAKWPTMSERIKVLFGKAIVIVLGILITFMSFLISVARTNVLELLYGMLGLIYGPLAGIYVLGFFFPWANAMGAFAGILSGYVVLAIVFAARHFLDTMAYVENIPPISTDLCPLNATVDHIGTQAVDFSTAAPTFATELERSFLNDISNINFNFFMFIGFLTAIIVGLIASFLSGHIPASKADPDLFIPLIDNKLFPKSVRTFFRFGVRDPKEMYIRRVSSK